ncbi:MAG: hypothetical protein IPK17_13750 [Chloroflexi bacterium]|uniref:hypothetical protein n=1 Tax=Candidatus Flexifilum breve TaxID=3140694 RepID=UPI003137099B|nr:hypothetical protein [Chloroflexota bacterium]
MCAATETRRAALTLMLVGGVCYGFHVVAYTDVLSALILPVTLALAFGWLCLVDHKADYAAILQSSRLFTLSDVFYNQPISWWQERIGQPIYLSAAAPYLVEIATRPRLGLVDAQAEIDGVIALDYFLVCHDGAYSLAVNWYTPTVPERDLSVFVHALDLAGNLITADQNAPVYGWRPLTTWTPREIVSDHYPLPRVGGLQEVRFGLYEQLPSGEFRNTVEYVITDIPECLP